MRRKTRRSKIIERELKMRRKTRRSKTKTMSGIGALSMKQTSPYFSNTFQNIGKPQSLPTRSDKKLAELKEKNTITESELKLIQRRINDKKVSESFFPKLWDGGGYKLTQEQNEKGKKWLTNLAYTPTGKEKENSPLQHREKEILKNFKEIRLKGFYSERGNLYLPLYEVTGNNTTMEYYVSDGKINIVG